MTTLQKVAVTMSLAFNATAIASALADLPMIFALALVVGVTTVAFGATAVILAVVSPLRRHPSLRRSPGR